ncbi:hypothetical protein PT276_08850 [Orbaceae bacterium ESL0721]|nr:hypothetical protein [Orbaceae bacterium ESL0721]
MMIFSTINLAHAAYTSVQTQGIITGTAPYFTFDDGATKVTDLSGLLLIKFSDGTVLTPDNNPTSASNPFELPNFGQSLADISMLIPENADYVDLSSLVTSDFIMDDNGDSDFVATGRLTVKVTDNDDAKGNRNGILDPCIPFYKITLTNTESSLKSKYGVPTTVKYPPSTVTYYVRSKISAGEPTACYAQPGNNYYYQYKVNGTIDLSIGFDTKEWLAPKGFIVRDITNLANIFPTMGAYGLFFNLSFMNADASTISYEKSPNNSGIDLAISTLNSKQVKVMLTGPRSGATVAEANSAVPTTFVIKSGSTPIYRFRINQWFIGGQTGQGFLPNYCKQTFGENYRSPTILEYTNSNGAGWSMGAPSQPNFFRRKIGGGLLAEWGALGSGTGMPLFYTETDFTSNPGVWTSDTNSNGWHYFVSLYNGSLTAGNYTSANACVTDF